MGQRLQTSNTLVTVSHPESLRNILLISGMTCPTLNYLSLPPPTSRGRLQVVNGVVGIVFFGVDICLTPPLINVEIPALAGVSIMSQAGLVSGGNTHSYHTERRTACADLLALDNVSGTR
jgi:hypothetical protein